LIDLSFIGWLTLAGAALLAWMALPALWGPWRLCVSIAFTALVAVVMLHPPRTVVVAPEAASRREPASVPPPAVAARKAAPEAVAPALPVVEPDPPKQVDPCVALAGLKKEHCKACGQSTGLTRALCEGAATNRYCNDKTGSDPDCPEAATPDPA
jgi:hypothetical protein